jgi:hypothetical protein
MRAGNVLVVTLLCFRILRDVAVAVDALVGDFAGRGLDYILHRRSPLHGELLEVDDFLNVASGENRGG